MNTQVTKLTLFFFGLLIATPNFACTDFRLTAKDGTVLISRSMEFAIDMKANIRNSPRGKEFKAQAPNGGPGLSWKAKYGYLFIDAFNQNIVVDGMNEAGLSFEYLYLPGETQYPAVPPGKDLQSLPYYQFGEWVLSNFKTVDEVKKALADVYVYQAFLPGAPQDIASIIFPLHASIYEANGKGIAVEFVNGKVNVYDSIGIMTNSPTYGWQVANLRNYLNLSPYSPKPLTINGVSYSSTGQGSGSVGLPGDVSPPSRFAKVAFLTTASFPVNNAVDVLNLGQHIINNVDIPTGVARSMDNGKESTDYTQWVVFKDLTHKVIYYRTYNDLTLRMVDMNKVDLSEDAQPVKMPLSNSPYMMDMTTKFANYSVDATAAKVKAINKTSSLQDEALKQDVNLNSHKPEKQKQLTRKHELDTSMNSHHMTKQEINTKLCWRDIATDAAKYGKNASLHSHVASKTKTLTPEDNTNKIKTAIKVKTIKIDEAAKKTAVKKVNDAPKVSKANKPLDEKLNAASNKN